VTAVATSHGLLQPQRCLLLFIVTVALFFIFNHA
jgi:hypothetical protein